jgi:hypothetical protein
MSHDEDLEPLQPDLEALLDAERQVPPAPTAARERVRGRLAATLGITALGASSAQAATAIHATGATPALGEGAGSTARAALKAAPQVIGKSILAKVTLGLIGLTGAIGIGVGAHLLRTHARPPAHAALPTAPAPTAPVAAPPIAIPSPAAPMTATPTAVPTPASPAPAARPTRHHAHEGEGDLVAERRLLDAAHAALARGDHAAALSALARDRREFPHGQLAEERDSLFIGALAASGRTDEARARAAAFRTRYPRSIFLPAVEATVPAVP